jgi:hypothetical protein
MYSCALSSEGNGERSSSTLVRVGRTGCGVVGKGSHQSSVGRSHRMAHVPCQRAVYENRRRSVWTMSEGWRCDPGDVLISDRSDRIVDEGLAWLAGGEDHPGTGSTSTEVLDAGRAVA